jgi:branched-chain amino acid transport system ATP-binding protein
MDPEELHEPIGIDSDDLRPIVVKNLVAGYNREVPILCGLNFSAPSGKLTAIIGPNGAGKSTFLRTLYGYLRPMGGEVLLEGRQLANPKPSQMLKRGVAYLLQGQSLFQSMTVQENLELGVWIYGSDTRRKSEALERIYGQYPAYRDRRNVVAGTLSGGEQRILEIARLLMTAPRILLLDEPSVGLMPKLVDLVYDELLSLKGRGLTMIMVDQNIRKATEICDQAYSFELGRDKFHAPRTEFVSGLQDIVKGWI